MISFWLFTNNAELCCNFTDVPILGKSGSKLAVRYNWLLSGHEARTELTDIFEEAKYALGQQRRCDLVVRREAAVVDFWAECMRQATISRSDRS